MVTSITSIGNAPTLATDATTVGGHLQHVDGIEVLTLSDHAFGLVRFVIALRHGAVVDAPGKQGALRMMFEMLMRGTKRADRRVWNLELESMGSSVDAQVGHEMALLRGTTLTRHLDATFALVTEAVTQPAFDEAQWDRLKDEDLDSVILERDDDDSVADLFMRKALYPGHTLGRAPSGDYQSIASLDIADIEASFKAFKATNMVVAFAGDIDPHKAAALTKPLAQALPGNPPVHPAVPTPLKASGMHIVLVDKPERTQVQMRVGALALDARHPDVDALWLGVTAFGGTFTSPFTQQVRDERGWSYVAHADVRRRSRFVAPMIMRCAPAVGDAVDCLKLNFDLFAQLAQGTLPDVATVDAARQYILNRYPFDIATAYDRLGLVLAQLLLGLPRDDVVQFPNHLEALAPEDASKAVARHLRPEGVVATLVASKELVLDGLQKQFPTATIDVVDYRQGLPQG